MRDMALQLVAQQSASNWITAGAIAIATIVLAWMIRRLTKRRIRRVDTQAEATDLAGRLLTAIVVALGAFYFLQALNVQIGPLLGALGVGALFIAVGLQPLLVNFVASVILQARRPFRRGDQVLTNGYEGTVIDITSTAVVLLSYNGEAIHVPNNQVLTNPLVNWTHEPVRRTELPLSVPYDCELPRVLSVLGRAARKSLDDDNLPPAEAIATGFGDHGIGVELRFWHYSDQLESLAARSQIISAVVEALAEIDVSIPYPQIVMHNAVSSAANPQVDTTKPPPSAAS